MVHTAENQRLSIILVLSITLAGVLVTGTVVNILSSAAANGLNVQPKTKLPVLLRQFSKRTGTPMYTLLHLGRRYLQAAKPLLA